MVSVRPPSAGTEQHLLDAARVLLTDGPDLPPEATRESTSNTIPSPRGGECGVSLPLTVRGASGHECQLSEGTQAPGDDAT